MSTEEVELASMGPLASDFAEQSDQVKLLYGLLDELQPAKREVFTLVEIDELTVPEVAGLLEIPLNTAYSRLRAARIDFEAALSRRSAPTTAARGRR